jgi:hypothetical protein
MIRRILRMKRDAQQTPLAAVQHPARDIEERRQLQHAVADYANPTRLFDDEDPSVIEGLGEKDGRGEPATDERIQLEA